MKIPRMPYLVLGTILSTIAVGTSGTYSQIVFVQRLKAEPGTELYSGMTFEIHCWHAAMVFFGLLAVSGAFIVLLNFFRKKK